jgi:hypothetical protein
MNRNHAVLAALIAAPLTFAACSSSSSHHSATNTVGSAPITAAHQSQPVSSAANAAGGGKNAWCTELRDAGESVIALGGNSTASPSEFKAKAEALAADAPDEIRDDVETIVKIDEKIVAGDAGAEDEIADPTVAAKVRHLVVWLSTNCKGVITDLPTNLPG